ncbi:hypothetical protein MBLNU457_3206t1 [Dothideomycetes sp. NU457]
MSGRYIGAALAIVCGVMTSYNTFAPELQKAQAERQGEFRAQHPRTTDGATAQEKGEIIPPNQTIISNDESIGKEVREVIRDATHESTAQKSWPGISLFKRAYGGDSSSNGAETGDTPGREGPITRAGNKS